VLRPSDQVGIHVSSAVWAPDGFGCSYGMGMVEAWATQSFRTPEPGRLSDTNAHDAAVVGEVTFHPITV